MPQQSTMLIPRIIKLIACVIVIGLLWGIVLPAVAKWPSVQQKKSKMETLGIEPGALFYTDHPGYENLIVETQN